MPRSAVKGAYKELWHFDSNADTFPDYAKKRHLKVAAKMSCLQTGYFMTSWRLAPGNYLGKVGLEPVEL